MELTKKLKQIIFTKSRNTNQSGTTSEYTDGKTSTQNNSSSSNIGTANRIENTPFTIVGNNQRGYFIGYGDAQITQPFKTKKQALKALDTHTWEIICNMTAYTVEHWQRIKEQALSKDRNEKTTFKK